jgi:hypothetical protein
MSTDTDTARLDLLMSPDLKARLQQHAVATELSMSAAARVLIQRGLEPVGVHDRTVFGFDAVRSPLGYVYEQGVGSHPREVQDAIFEAEQKAGRRLHGWEVARILHGDSLENSVADAAASIEDLVK